MRRAAERLRWQPALQPRTTTPRALPAPPPASPVNALVSPPAHGVQSSTVTRAERGRRSHRSRILETRRLALESQATGESILHQLQSQRETLLRTQATHRRVVHCSLGLAGNATQPVDTLARM